MIGRHTPHQAVATHQAGTSSLNGVVLPSLESKVSRLGGRRCKLPSENDTNGKYMEILVENSGEAI